MKPWARNHKCLLLISVLPAFGAVLLFVASSTVEATVSYDTDSDGLIEISTLAQLNAIRWDLDGDGTVDNGTNRVAFTTAFPDAAAGMGCAAIDHDGHSATPDVPVCTGYELKADLDFDTDGDGAVDAADEYWHSGAGWRPIGSSGTANEFIATFEGNGHTVTRMYHRSFLRPHRTVRGCRQRRAGAERGGSGGLGDRLEPGNHCRWAGGEERRYHHRELCDGVGEKYGNGKQRSRGDGRSERRPRRQRQQHRRQLCDGVGDGLELPGPSRWAGGVQLWQHPCQLRDWGGDRYGQLCWGWWAGGASQRRQHPGQLCDGVGDRQEVCRWACGA